MAQAFGKTWWGSEWLKALTHIDYANRIPRGSAYARKGAVRSIEVKGNVIFAKVSGSRPTPYKVTIKVPIFSQTGIDRLMEKLMQQPALISKLLNRELDPEVLQICKHLGLPVFPNRWNDLEMKCTCPDWAVPCKHLAECILSYLLGLLIPVLSASSGGDTFRDLFFKGQGSLFNGVGETSIPGSIRSWLDRFFLSQRQYRPSLLIAENDFGGFTLDVAIDRNGEPVLLKDILSDSAFDDQRFAILKELSLLSSLIRGLEQYINRNGSSPVLFTSAEFVPFLFEAIPAIRLLGVKVMLPKSLQNLIRPRVSMKISKKQNDGKTYLRLDQMLQFDWQVALGDQLITPAEFEQLTRRALGLIRFKQQYIYVSEADILLTTYGVLRSDITKLKKLPWRVAIIDEAQNIKNADTAQSKAVRSIPADTHIAMSGTPVESRLSEFWSIMDFCNSGYLGTAKSFKEDFANPIQRQGDEHVAERFRRITAPFLMRRLKTDKTIINDLPDKIEQNELALPTVSGSTRTSSSTASSRRTLSRSASTR